MMLLILCYSFDGLDGNRDGYVSRDEFVTGLTSLKEIDITDTECLRLFSAIDEAGDGVVSFDQFMEEVYRYRWLKSVVVLYYKAANCEFEIKQNYDFTKSTNDNYAFEPVPGCDEKFFGDFKDIRATRDYNWHGNYTMERQLWQDRAVKSCLGKTEPQARPWIVYSWFVIYYF